MYRDFYTVIPAGGAGTRLWPLSRSRRPKFLLPLLGDKSLLQLTAQRVAPIAPPDRLYIVSGKAHVAAIARQLPAIPESNLLVEPGMRGTGSAIALAAFLITRRDGDAIMGSFAADHRIANTAEFLRTLGIAIESAEAGYLTTIGIEPSHPETGFGYIERTDDLAIPGAYFARRFVEKPDSATAQRFLESGHYLWNASMFVWRVDVFLREFERIQPDLYAAIERIAIWWDDPDRADEIERAWLDLPVTTIDHGLMEHVDEFVVVPVDMGWSDIGDWNGFAEVLEPDANGNCINGNVLAEDSSDCVVWSENDRPIALVGLRNLAIVDLPDALLVVDRARAQEVRSIVSKLECDRPDLI